MNSIKQPPRRRHSEPLLFDLATFYEKSSLPFSNVPYFSPSCQLQIFQGVVKLSNKFKVTYDREVPVREKNDIVNFSKNSRLRMMKLLGKVHYQSYGTPIFLTTTFHNIGPSNRQELKKILDNYIRSLHKLKFNFHVVWRLEFQKRGMPHFHFILLPLSQLDENQTESLKRNVKVRWFRYLKDYSYFSHLYSCKFIPVYDMRSVSSYLSKYMAKCDLDSNNRSYGRFWGYTRALKLKPYATFKFPLKFYMKIKKIICDHLKQRMQMDSVLDDNFDSLNGIEIFLRPDELLDLFRQNLFDKSNNNFFEAIEQKLIEICECQ